MRKLIITGVAMATGLTLAGAGGTAIVSAASPSPNPSAAASAGSCARAAHPLVCRIRRHIAAGEVVSDSATGGSLGQGQLVIKEPDGAELTLNLAQRTKAWRYQGQGTKPVSESPSQLPSGEIVAVVGRSYKGQPAVVQILDLGFQAAG